ncbi:MAG: 6-phosphogluconolactonase [Gemmatimonadaceae bacterium]
MTGTSPENVEVFPSAAELATAAAERFVGAASAAISANGTFLVALSGGSTPHALFALLASPAYSRRVEWPRVHLFWGDERCVPPDDESSNYRMARETLIDHVPLPPENVHRMRGEDPPAAAAERYEQELRAAFATPTGAPRAEPRSRFDLVLLGLGTNGHTASLFPHLRAVHEHKRWVVAEDVEMLQMWRVTLTPDVINAAAEILFLVSGHEKAPVLRRVLRGPRMVDDLPAQAIAPADGRLLWLVDAPAASELLSDRRASVTPR